MLQTLARLTRLHARAWAYMILPWYTWHVILYHGNICSLVLQLIFCRYSEELHSTRLPTTPIISNLVMTKYPQPFLLMEGRRQLNHILDIYLMWSHLLILNWYHVKWIYLVLPCMTNPCRWKKNQNKQGLLPTQDDLHQHRPSTTSSSTCYVINTTQRYVLISLKKLYSKSWDEATQVIWRY